MSTPVVPDQGELDLLLSLQSATWKLRLFTGATTPGNTSVIGDFTEATFSGYPSGGTTLSYGTPATVSNTGTMTATQIDFTHNGGATANTVTGYYIVNTGTTKLIKAERFDNAITMANNGDKISITDKFLQAGTIIA